MAGQFLIKDTLGFDLYGDISFDLNDVVVKTDIKALIQILADYLKTNYGDYKFYDKFGSNYDEYIGKGLTTGLITALRSKIEKDILNLGLVPRNSLTVLAVKESITAVQVRIILYNIDDYTIYMTLDKIEGTLIDY